MMTFIDKYCMDVQQSLFWPYGNINAELPDCVEQNKMTELAGIRIQQFVWSNTCRTTLYRVIAMRYTDSWSFAWYSCVKWHRWNMARFYKYPQNNKFHFYIWSEIRTTSTWNSKQSKLMTEKCWSNWNIPILITSN